MASRRRAHHNDQSLSEHRAARPKAQSTPEEQPAVPADAAQKARIAPWLLTPRDVLHLQRTTGNRAVGRLLAQTTQHYGLLQRALVGTGDGTDNDRNTIKITNLEENEKVDITGDNQGRAKVKKFIVDENEYNNKLLKHYMVVKSGTKYQFPLKHIYQPKLSFGNFDPNQGKFDNNRGGQPEGFGGNMDIKKNEELNDASLTESRDETLKKEYKEESRINNANLNVTTSKKFGSDFGVGTLSIATTDKELEEGYKANPLDQVSNRGEAEMAGTIVIDCNELIDGKLVDDELEQAIGKKIQDQRDAFFNDEDLDKGFKKENRLTQNIFATAGGILAHLVGLVKDDILIERIRRNDEKILKEKLRLEEEEKEKEKLRLEEEEKRKEAKKKLLQVLLGLGIIISLAIIVIKLLFGTQNHDEL